MKNYTLHYYRNGQPFFVTTIKSESQDKAYAQANTLFIQLKCYDEYGLSSWD